MHTLSHCWQLDLQGVLTAVRSRVTLFGAQLRSIHLWGYGEVIAELPHAVVGGSREYYQQLIWNHGNAKVKHLIRMKLHTLGVQ